MKFMMFSQEEMEKDKKDRGIYHSPFFRKKTLDTKHHQRLQAPKIAPPPVVGAEEISSPQLKFIILSSSVSARANYF